MIMLNSVHKSCGNLSHAATTYSNINKIHAEIMAISLTKDRNVESRFEQKSSPVGITRKRVMDYV